MNFIRLSGVGDGVVAPLSTLLIQHLMMDLGLDRLSFHHTVIDPMIGAKEVNKGNGLLALRDRVLGDDAETIAVGDQEPDLTMFREPDAVLLRLTSVARARRDFSVVRSSVTLFSEHKLDGCHIRLDIIEISAR
jgi:hypothetical protein